MAWILVMLMGCDSDTKQPEVDVEVRDTASDSATPIGEPTDEPEPIDTAEERPDFDFADPFTQNVGQHNTILDVMDVDSDGYPDLVTIVSGGVLSWLKGDGSGMFLDQGVAWDGDLNAMVSQAHEDIEGTPIVVNDGRTELQSFGDWNGDGQLDMLISLSATHNAQSIYAAGIVESFRSAPYWRPMQISNQQLSISKAASQFGFAFVIFNAPEVLFWDAGVLRSFPYSSALAKQGTAVTADFNGDGLADWAVLADDGSGFKDFALFYRNEQGVLETGPTAVPPEGQRLEFDDNEYWVATLEGVFGLDDSQAWKRIIRHDPPIGYTLIGHFNGDDRLDVLHEHIETGVEAFAGLGSEEVIEVTTNAPLPKPGMRAADLDNSGTDDIFSLQATNDGYSLTVWLNQR